MYIYIYIYIKSATRHLKYSYISIFTNLLGTDNETKSVKLKKDKKDKEKTQKKYKKAIK